jgi:hypothetical protein
MELASLLIPIVAVSAYLASVACRLARRRQRQPAWYLVLATSLATAAVVVVVGYLGILSVPGDVPKIGGLRYWSRIAPTFFALSSVLALLPGFVVLLLYRRRRSAYEKMG